MLQSKETSRVTESGERRTPFFYRRRSRLRGSPCPVSQPVNGRSVSGHKTSDFKSMPPGRGKQGRGEDGVNGLPQVWEPAPRCPGSSHEVPACAHRVWCAWCSTTAACSTRSSSSWMGGAGAGLGTASWTSVSGEGELLSGLEAHMDGDV